MSQFWCPSFFHSWGQLCVCVCVCVCVCSVMSSICDPVDCSPPGSSIHRILQARILEWVVLGKEMDLPNPGNELSSPALAGRLFATEPPGMPPWDHLTPVCCLMPSSVSMTNMYSKQENIVSPSPQHSPTLGLSIHPLIQSLTLCICSDSWAMVLLP